MFKGIKSLMRQNDNIGKGEEKNMKITLKKVGQDEMKE